jgi:acetyl esterase
MDDPPLRTLTPEKARARFRGLQAGCFRDHLCLAEQRIISSGPARGLALFIFRPRGIPGPLPVVLYFHGGGWLMGDGGTHQRLARALCSGSGAAVILLEYTRTPEARYPVAVEQGWAAARWLAENGAAIGLDTHRLAVAGDGTGGNLAAAVTLLSKRRGGPPIRFQALFSPLTDAVCLDSPSYQQFGVGGDLFTRADMAWLLDLYAPNAACRAEPILSLLRASLDALQGLPPALVITGERDILRDEGEAFAHRLMQAGVPVTATRYLGAIHGFVALNPLAHTLAAQTALAQASACLRKALSR